jgi:septal ring-binding cell division protein DamX
MKNAKLILLALAILLAAVAVWLVVGFVVTAVKFLFVLAIIVFGISIFRKLAGKSSPERLAEKDTDRELNESLRQLEEIKRRQLIK